MRHDHEDNKCKRWNQAISTLTRLRLFALAEPRNGGSKSSSSVSECIPSGGSLFTVIVVARWSKFRLDSSSAEQQKNKRLGSSTMVRKRNIVVPRLLEPFRRLRCFMREGACGCRRSANLSTILDQRENYYVQHFCETPFFFSLIFKDRYSSIPTTRVNISNQLPRRVDKIAIDLRTRPYPLHDKYINLIWWKGHSELEVYFVVCLVFSWLVFFVFSQNCE